MTDASGPRQLDYAQAVHQLAQLVPAGAVISYGDVAELLGSGGPRQVGKAMTTAEVGIPWWRVLRADGNIAEPLLPRAREHWEREKLARPGKRVDIKNLRWNPTPKQWEAIDILRLSLGNPKMSELDDEL
ncbi:MGMT family protein [Arthrobacter sp. NIO-1057]|uniref:MGMT family protein n=1 Tax=Arthrobacter sp. NIO-1057 TaxID=993071 RepID=UPI000817964E|nr:MGMT family protein [Arthrobacter sp. NIO-1057]SCB95423.1 Alkylated DNA nucleotide flippase Atl1, participates in nucleotide excision repair, Ada-like DNA-binding domain [Arthrobacter sp. NIO-1057]